MAEKIEMPNIDLPQLDRYDIQCPICLTRITLSSDSVKRRTGQEAYPIKFSAICNACNTRWELTQMPRWSRK
jgi:hypothetical protein